jgi:AAA ATPase domain
MNNPYRYGQVAQGPDFFGRRKQLDTIANWVTQVPKQDVLLEGRKGLGKTSLLLQLESRLRGEWAYIPVYFSLRQAPQTTEGLVLAAAKAVVATLVQRGILDAALAEAHPLTRFDAIEEELGTLLAAVPVDRLQGRRVVLLLDDFDVVLSLRIGGGESPRGSLGLALPAVLKGRLAPIEALGVFAQPQPSRVDVRVQNMLRGMLESSLGAYVSAVIAVEDSSALADSGGSIAFHCARSVLPPLVDGELTGLICGPAAACGYEYTPEAIRRIAVLSGGFPAYCQALCAFSFDHAQREGRARIGVEDVAAAEERVLVDLLDLYRHTWQGLDGQARQFCVALARHAENLPHASKQTLWALRDRFLLAEGGELERLALSALLFEPWTLQLAREKQNV